MITLYIKGQELKVNQCTIASDTIDYITVKANFRTADWNGLSKVVHFKQGENDYAIVLDSDNEIKENQHLNLTNGTYEVWVHGNDDNKRITTTISSVTVQKTGGQEGEPPIEVPLSVGEQILQKAENAENTVNEVKNLADSGAFNGKDGQNGADGKDGEDGNGIERIEKVSTSGLVDTYRIYLTDGTTYDYTVTNGKDGDSGTGETDYNDLENKPSINGVELEGNKTADDLGLLNRNPVMISNDASSPTTTNDFENNVLYEFANDGYIEIISRKKELLGRYHCLKGGFFCKCGAVTHFYQLLMTENDIIRVLEVADGSGDAPKISSLSSIDLITADIEMFYEALTTIADTLDNKVDKEDGKGLSTNDYTDEDKQKVENALTEIPLATENTIGGVMLPPATEDMTQKAGIDSNGFVVVPPNGGSSGEWELISDITTIEDGAKTITITDIDNKAYSQITMYSDFTGENTRTLSAMLCLFTSLKFDNKTGFLVNSICNNNVNGRAVANFVTMNGKVNLISYCYSNGNASSATFINNNNLFGNRLVDITSNQFGLITLDENGFPAGLNIKLYGLRR